VATHSGNRFILQTPSGRAVPMNRAQGPVFPAAVFEAVGATSSIRTVRHYADAAMRVWIPFTVESDVQGKIVHPLLLEFDTRMWVVRLSQTETDISLLVIRPFVANGDTRQAVSAALEQHEDTEQRVVRQLWSSYDVGQTIFAVLINESHVIQT
jgi:hypothetical protein